MKKKIKHQENINWKHFEPIFEYEEVFPDFHEAWSGHKYFAYDLIANIKPKVIVELGTHKGTSFLSFCQAVKDFGLSTDIYAVDTWKGDPHAGFYGEEIFENFNLIINKFYQSLSTVLHRETFDEAVHRFSDFSVDVLHIDGYHTYDAVRHDFETWIPKVSKNGVVLLHDTNEKRDDFGVYKFWEELLTRYQNNISFFHSHGLGVLFLSYSKEYLTHLKRMYFDACGYYALYSEKEKYLGLSKYYEMQSWQHSQEIVTLKYDITKKELQNQVKENVIQEKENQFMNAEQIIYSLYNSYSWRITSPLRWTYLKVLKLFHIFFPNASQRGINN